MKTEPCPWCLGDDEYVEYHDREWGVPSRDPQHLFEMLILEGAQAGLSWLTILRKREGYRRAFEGFDVNRIAAYGAGDVKRLLADAGIVRNRLKVNATIGNARPSSSSRPVRGSRSFSGISSTVYRSRTAGVSWSRCRPVLRSQMP